LLDGLSVCGSKPADASVSGVKLQYLQSFQADRCATGRLTLIECRAATRLRSTPTPFSAVLASKSMPKFQQFHLIRNAIRLGKYSGRSAVNRDAWHFYNINHLAARVQNI
jgi:hypothetical protein